MKRIEAYETDYDGCLLNYDGMCRHPEAPEKENDYSYCQGVVPESCALKKTEVLVTLRAPKTRTW